MATPTPYDCCVPGWFQLPWKDEIDLYLRVDLATLEPFHGLVLAGCCTAVTLPACLPASSVCSVWLNTLIPLFQVPSEWAGATSSDSGFEVMGVGLKGYNGVYTEDAWDQERKR